ncbi:MAG: glycosyltransferase [Gammaproteobacteria bacterium]|nr:glycosyltransferase [Gammaproteobacteria bacterium]
MHPRKIKVTHVITSLSSGGAQVLLYELLKNANHSKFDMEVVCLGKSGPIAELIAGLPCKITYLKANKVFPLLAAWRLFKIFKSARPDAVHTWMYHADFLGGLAAKMAGLRKIIWSIHHSDAANLKTTTKWVMKLCARLSYYLPSKIVLTAKNAQSYHESYAYQTNKMTVISNAIDPEKFVRKTELRTATRQRLGIAENEFVWGSFTRFHPQKGLGVLLKAYSQVLQQSSQPSKLILAGFAMDSSNLELRELVEKYQLNDKVILLGEIQKVADYLPALDSLLSASISGETSPLIIMEAMSCELPCVVSKIGDCAEIIADSGYAVKANDANALAKAMTDMMGLSVEHRQALGQLARNRVLQHYHIKNMTSAYENLYSSKKVLILGSSVQSLIRFRLHLMKDWQKMGYQVMAAAPEDKNAESVLAQYAIQFTPIRLKHTSLNPFSDIKAILDLRKILKYYQPDYVLSYTLKPILYGSWLAKRYQVAHIGSMLTGLGYVFSGNSFKQSCLQSVLKRLLKKVFEWNQVVFFQNPDDAKQFIDNKLIAADKVTILNGSGVELNEYPLKPYPQKCSFILLARLLHEKGIADYAAAAKIIKSRYPDVKFLLAGPHYPSPSSIKQSELDEWLASAAIEYLGDLKDVRPALEQASVFVLPSYYREGTPRAILEAMAMGRAIITTTMPGCRETVELGKNGYLVPIKNPQALASAMQHFIEQPDLVFSMGQASRKLAEEKYDVCKVNQAIIKAFKMSD